MEPEDIVRGKDRPYQDRLDQWLDTALREYGSAEPRIGLENRVLANLAAEKTRVHALWPWWAFGAVAAMAAVGMVVWLGGIGHSKFVGKTTSPLQKTDTAKEQSEIKRPPLEAAAQPRARRRSAKTVEATEEPRLSQFPSPRPLSEQERLLLAYVTEFPEEAAKVAHEQAQREKELEALYPVVKLDPDSQQER
jgi:hypothetical protein